MLAALLLGLLGSLGHCVGMCTGVQVLLGGRGAPLGVPWLTLHLGRVSSYVLLGGLAGALGAGVSGSLPPAHTHAHTHTAAAPAWAVAAQGGLALAGAGIAGYLALALLGRAPAPEVALSGLTRHWTRRMHRLSGRLAHRPGSLTRFAAGLVWGLLPCGLVLTALLVAAASGSAMNGAAAMLAFGLGTLPALLASGWLAARAARSAHVALHRPTAARAAAAAVVLLFGAQMAFRGLATFGVVDHLVVGGVMIW